jgi:hypothetical protein
MFMQTLTAAYFSSNYGMFSVIRNVLRAWIYTVHPFSQNIPDGGHDYLNGELS